MFGLNLNIKLNDTEVFLTQYDRKYAEHIAKLSSSIKVKRFSGGSYAWVEDDVIDMFESLRKSRDSVYWLVFADKSKLPIGYTGINSIARDGGCTFETMIFDTSFWNKGIGTQVAMLRVWYATKQLNRSFIKAIVAEGNGASLKILKKIGFFETGKHIRSVYRDGVYYDNLVMYWLNPDRVDVLYPEGVPPEYEKYIKIAEEVLERVDKNIKV